MKCKIQQIELETQISWRHNLLSTPLLHFILWIGARLQKSMIRLHRIIRVLSFTHVLFSRLGWLGWHTLILIVKEVGIVGATADYLRLLQQQRTLLFEGTAIE